MTKIFEIDFVKDGHCRYAETYKRFFRHFFVVLELKTKTKDI